MLLVTCAFSYYSKQIYTFFFLLYHLYLFFLESALPQGKILTVILQDCTTRKNTDLDCKAALAVCKQVPVSFTTHSKGKKIRNDGCVYMCVHIFMHTHVSPHTCVYTHMYTCRHMYVYIYVHFCNFWYVPNLRFQMEQKGICKIKMLSACPSLQHPTS